MQTPTIPQHVLDRMENEWRQVAPAPRQAQQPTPPQPQPLPQRQ